MKNGRDIQNVMAKGGTKSERKTHTGQKSKRYFNKSFALASFLSDKKNIWEIRNESKHNKLWEEVRQHEKKKNLSKSQIQ